MCSLSPLISSRQIGDSIRRFGVSDSSTRLVVVRVADSSKEDFSPTTVEALMKSVVEGDLVKLSQLPEFCDRARLRKVDISTTALLRLTRTVQYYKIPEGMSNELGDEIVVSTVASKAAA
jgi:EKC/KEOPS complex subunit CGI121/TPRKB